LFTAKTIKITASGAVTSQWNNLMALADSGAGPTRAA
jgi:hypothetical protein